LPHSGGTGRCRLLRGWLLGAWLLGAWLLGAWLLGKTAARFRQHGRAHSGKGGREATTTETLNHDEARRSS
jgi:hypothetical protein